MLGTMLLGESFLRDNYVGDKSSKKHLGQFPGGYCQGAIAFEIIFWEQSSRGQLPQGQFSLGAIIRGQSSRGQLSGGGDFPQGKRKDRKRSKILS